MMAIVVVTHLVLMVLLLTVNKTVRYLVLISPYVGVLVASMLCALAGGKISARHFVAAFGQRAHRRLLAGLLILVFAGTQFVGNLWYLYIHRDTGYYDFTGRVKALVPQDASVLGTITYWYAFHRQPYYTYMVGTYDDMTQKLKPDVYLLDDRVMVYGNRNVHRERGRDYNEWALLREQLHQHVSEHCVFLGEVPNWFYGDVKVYRTKGSLRGVPDE